MTRKIICDFCSHEVPELDPHARKITTLNWSECLTHDTDICARCAIQVVQNLVDGGHSDVNQLVDVYNSQPLQPQPPLNPRGDDDEDLDFDPEDIPLDFGPNDSAVTAAKSFAEAAEIEAQTPITVGGGVGRSPDHGPDATPDDVFHLTMHGAGLNPEHELLFQTLDEAKDYAVKNAQVFPQAAYALACPDGTRLAGGTDPQWAPEKGGHVALHWKVVAAQPGKA